jgi:hypothetical protein
MLDSNGETGGRDGRWELAHPFRLRDLASYLSNAWERTVIDFEYIGYDDVRFDLTRTIGLIVPPPAGLYVATVDPQEHARRIAELVAEVRRDALAQYPLAEIPDTETRLVVYQDGPPRAGGDPGGFVSTLFMVLVNDVAPIVGSVDAMVRVGSWVLNVYRRLATAKTLEGIDLYSDAGFHLGITPQGIRAACVADAVGRYRLDLGAVTPEAFTRDTFYGDARHPTTSMHTTVSVGTASGGQYLYVVSGAGAVIEHCHIADGTVTPLQCPARLEYLGRPAEALTAEGHELVVAGPVRVE